MDPSELARWSRFSAKGGIGKCTAIKDCVAKEPDDLMFLKDDEITVLMQLPQQEDMFLGHCEGVVGRFQGSYVRFHAKLKKPVMTKRSSTIPAKSPTPTHPSPSPRFEQPSGLSSVRHSKQPVVRSEPEEDGSLIPSMSYSSSSTLSDVPLPTPPLPIHSITPPAAPQTSESTIMPFTSKNKPFPPIHSTHTRDSSYENEDFSRNSRLSLALSDGEVGIGLSLLQNLANGDGDDWSSTSSRYSVRSRSRTPEKEVNDDVPIGAENKSLKDSPRNSVRHSTATASSSKHRSGHGSDWEGASDIYDDYRYSRFSSGSKLSRFSTSSHPSTSAAATDVPPPVPLRNRSESLDSDVSVYTQASKQSVLKEATLQSEPEAKGVDGKLQSGVSESQVSQKGRPAPLDLNAQPSPLLHTRWGSPVTSSSDYSSGASFLSPSLGSPGFEPASQGLANSIRQRIEIERMTPSPQFSPKPNATFDDFNSKNNIVIEDEEELPSHVAEEPFMDDDLSREDDQSQSTEEETLKISSLPMLDTRDITRTPSPVLYNDNDAALDDLLSPPDLALPPASSDLPPSARPPLPSLSELRGYKVGPDGVPDITAQRTSLFLPHPNAPKSTGQGSGPMYIRKITNSPTPVLSPQTLRPQMQSISTAVDTIHQAMTSQPRPGNQRGPTIFGRVEVDLNTANGPVPIAWSVEPPLAAAPPPPVQQVPTSLTHFTNPFTPVHSSLPNEPVVGNQTGGSQREVPSPLLKPSNAAIPRANFFPKVGTARPRSRSFSGFDTSTSPIVGIPRSYEEGSSGSKRTGASNGIPPPYGAPRTSRSSSFTGSAPELPQLNANFNFGKSPSNQKQRPGHAPSPLSLPQNNSAATLGLSGVNGGIKPPRSPTAPRSPTPLRQMTSRSTLNEGMAPRKLQKQQSMQSIVRQNSGDHSRNATKDIEINDQSSSSSVGRQLSLRSKLSLPNLRRNQGSQGSISGLRDTTRQPETLQVKDMDFEMVRPALSHSMPKSSSEDSVSNQDPSRETSFDGFRSSGFKRSESPAFSTISNSDQLSPDSATSRITRTSDTEPSADAHRQRELKWVTLMSQIPASQSRKSKKLRKLLVDGVPSSVRYLVWSHLMDAKARNVPNVYTQLSKRGSVAASEEISRDVKRCFKDNPQLLSTQGPLVGVLEAYFNMVPDIQYRAGLTLIAGHLLLLAPEEDAFWIFVCMMDAYLRPYFAISTNQLEVDAALFSKALENNDAQVFKKVLTEFSISPVKFCYPWFTGLFVGAVPIEYLNRIWDLFMFEGIPLLLRAGLAIMYCSRRAILEATSEDAILSILRKPSPNWLPPSADAFLSLAFSMKVKDDDVKKQRIKMEAQLKRQTQRMTTAPGTISLPRS